MKAPNLDPASHTEEMRPSLRIPRLRYGRRHRRLAYGCLGAVVWVGLFALVAAGSVVPSGTVPSAGLFDGLLSGSLGVWAAPAGLGTASLGVVEPIRQELTHHALGRIEVGFKGAEIYYAFFPSDQAALADIDSGPPGGTVQGFPVPAAIASGTTTTGGSKTGYTLIDFTEGEVIGGAITYSTASTTTLIFR